MISIIIPVINEEKNLDKLLPYLLLNSKGFINEIFVADGGSEDESYKVAKKYNVRFIKCTHKSRARQMNEAAAIAKSNILYFVHADTLPPKTYAADIMKAIAEQYDFGRFCLRFESSDLRLSLNSICSRFDMFECYGGDQTFFITRELFNNIDGFDDNKLIMEDFDICERARRKGRFKIIHKQVTVSARKYETNGWLKVQKANYKMIQLYKKGCDQKLMIETYKQLLQTK